MRRVAADRGPRIAGRVDSSSRSSSELSNDRTDRLSLERYRRLFRKAQSES
jgi:hypothetical protein